MNMFYGRFYPLFSQPNINKIESNNFERVDELVKTAFWDEDLTSVYLIVSDLRGMGYGSASLLFYLKNPKKYNVFLPVTVRGIKEIYPQESKKLNYRRPF